MEFRFGWLVCPLMEAMAPSTMSTPASAAFRMEAALHAAGVVGVEMDRDADLLAKRLHQLLGGVGPAQPRHVLDGQHVRAHFFQFLGHADVILRANTCRALGSRMSPV